MIRKPPFQFRLTSLFRLTTLVAFLAWLGWKSFIMSAPLIALALLFSLALEQPD
jgi:hypothetical protein